MRTFFTSYLKVYCEKQPDGPFKKSKSSVDVIKRIAELIYGNSRNIAADNLFSAVPLTNYLISKSLLFVGTIKKTDWTPADPK